MNVDSEYAISFHQLTIHLLIFGSQYTALQKGTKTVLNFDKILY